MSLGTLRSAGFAVLALAACAPRLVRVNGFAIREARWNDAFSAVTTHATVEFKCPTEALQITLLETLPSWPELPGSIKVEGCGLVSVYRWARSTGWVALGPPSRSE